MRALKPRVAEGHGMVQFDLNTSIISCVSLLIVSDGLS